MSTKTLINIKADKDVKEEAQALAFELGLSLSAVMNAFLKEFLRSRSIAFSAVPRMTPVLEAILGEVEEDIKHGRNTSRAFHTGEEIRKHLESI